MNQVHGFEVPKCTSVNRGEILMSAINQDSEPETPGAKNQVDDAQICDSASGQMNLSVSINGEDYFQVGSDEIRRNNPLAIDSPLRRKDVVLLNVTSYLMLVK